jgi:hypothetical protein
MQAMYFLYSRWQYKLIGSVDVMDCVNLSLPIL